MTTHCDDKWDLIFFSTFFLFQSQKNLSNWFVFPHKFNLPIGHHHLKGGKGGGCLTLSILYLDICMITQITHPFFAGLPFGFFWSFFDWKNFCPLLKKMLIYFWRNEISLFVFLILSCIVIKTILIYICNSFVHCEFLRYFDFISM